MIRKFSDKQLAVISALNSPHFQSIAQLANKLAESEQNLLKVVQLLQANGLPIVSSSQGFRLATSSQILNSCEIQSQLQTQQSIAVEVFCQIESTNQYLLDNGAQKQLCLTEMQSQGVGRRNAVWVAKPFADIMLSIGVPLPKNHRLLPLLSLMVANHLRSTIAQYCPKVQVKWPNDIYVGNQKIAGILVQAKHLNNTTNYVVIGIGINIEAQVATMDFPYTYVLQHFNLQSNQLFDRNQLIVALVSSFLNALNSPIATANILQQWCQHAMYWQQMVCVFNKDNHKIMTEGRFVAIAKDGALTVETTTGKRYFHSAEVSLRAL